MTLAPAAALDRAARLLDTPPTPPVPGQLAVEVTLAEPTITDSLAKAFAARTRPVEGGHRIWAAGVNSHGVGRFQHAGTPYTARQAAFILRTGRQPIGQVRPSCDVPQCVDPDHVDDRPTRQRDRATLAAVAGIAHRPPACDHNEAEHVRHRADGRRYCNACNNPSTAECEHGNPQCGAPARPYPCGTRCEEHQPSRTRPFYSPAP